MKSRTAFALPFLLLAVSGLAAAQDTNPTSQGNLQLQGGPQPMQQTMENGEPIYKIQVVGRDLPAINYFNRKGSTKVGFQGTSLLAEAKGEARVDSRAGRTSIDLDVQGLPPANGFGPEYLTYVLWAISPEGRPINLGEILPNGSKEKEHLTVTTNLQSFGLIVTAEPYFAVIMPSDLVVMQNYVQDRTQGVIEQVNAHYTLLPRGAYAETAGKHTVLNPITRKESSPLELYEAVNAVRIADAAGAGTYAADTLTTARLDLKNATDMDTHNGDRKEEITFAREAVQAAEDARIMTIRKIKADDDAAQVKARRDAELSAQQSQAEAAAAQAAAQQQALARQQADSARQQAEAAAAEAEARAAAARQQQQAAELSAQQAAQQAEQMRERLKQQLNQVLQTTETARGLIVNMSDVLFDFNKYSLKPEAREKLAKVSGILLAYPGLKMQVEGYTDSIGSDEYNQKLSEQRAEGVKDYLVGQSVSDANISATGYGKNDPIADNSSASGRAQNRRVELVVSGSAIGIEQQSSPGAQSSAPTAPAGNAAVAGQTGVSNPPSN